MNKKKLTQFLKTFLPLGLGIFFIVYSYNEFTPEERHELYQNIKQINPVWIIISISGGLLSHLSRAYRWKLLLEPLGYKLRLFNSFMAVMSGYLANLGIPRSGEVLRGATVSTYENIPFDKVFGTIIAERAVDVVMLSLVLLTTIFFHTTELLSLFDEFQINPWISIGGILVLIALGILALKLIKRSKLPIFLKIKSFVTGILQGVRSILHMKKNAVFIAHTVFIWAMYIGMFFILKFAFPETHALPIGAVLVGFIVGSFAISVTNGGIGIYPIAIGGALALFGISHETGEAYGWIDWGSQTILNIVIGGLSMILLPIINRKVNAKTR